MADPRTVKARDGPDWKVRKCVRKQPGRVQSRRSQMEGAPTGQTGDNLSTKIKLNTVMNCKKQGSPLII